MRDLSVCGDIGEWDLCRKKAYGLASDQDLGRIIMTSRGWVTLSITLRSGSIAPISMH